MVDWDTVLVVFIIVIGLGLYFRHATKPRIEQVYESNRNYVINGMLNDIYIMDRFMGHVFELLDNKKGFDPHDERQLFNFSQKEDDKIRSYYSQTHRISDAFKKFSDYNVHLKQEEYEVLINYVYFSDQFVESLLKPREEYVKDYLEQRKKYAKQILKLFDGYLTKDFKSSWKYHL